MPARHYFPQSDIRDLALFAVVKQFLPRHPKIYGRLFRALAVIPIHGTALWPKYSWIFSIFRLHTVLINWYG
jgi:hypothetical protein